MYPFSAECKDQDLRTLAQLDAVKIKFVNVTRNIVKEQGRFSVQSYIMCLSLIGNVH